MFANSWLQDTSANKYFNLFVVIGGDGSA